MPTLFTHHPLFALLVALLLLNVLTYGLFAWDKRAAQRGGWRVPEATLLFCVALGGGIGAWRAMERFRHKTKKGSFRIAFYAASLFSLVALIMLGWQLHF